MEYTQKAGVREFAFVLLLIMAIALLGDLVGYVFPKPPMLRDLVVIAAGSVLVYFIYTRYCARITMLLGEDALVVRRQIARRTKETRVQYTAVSEMSDRKPDKKPSVCELYTTKILPRGRCYISYGSRLLVIEAQQEFLQKLKEKING